MKLQSLIDQTELDMTVPQVKAFFLGILTAQKPMPFHKALEELLSATPEAKDVLEKELKTQWDELVKNHPAELQKMFPENKDVLEYLKVAKDQLDYFLTAMSLSGTSADTDDEDLADLIDELEDTVMEMDEYVVEAKPDLEEGQELKEAMLESWQDFIKSHRA